MTKTLKRITIAEVETLQKISIETFSDGRLQEIT